MKIKEYIKKIVANGKQEDMEQLSDILADLMHCVKERDKELYDKFKMKLYVLAYGKVLTEDMAMDIVDDMKPYGEYWDIETTTAVKNQYGLYNISEVDFYVVMNKTYNDNTETVNKFADTDEKRLEMYVSLSKDFILDKDAKEGKVFTYFTKIPQ